VENNADSKKEAINSVIAARKQAIAVIKKTTKEVNDYDKFLEAMGVSSDASESLEEALDTSSKEAGNNYPKSGEREPKVIYILGEYLKRCALLREIKEGIEELEGPLLAKSTLKSLLYHMDGMIKSAQLATSKVGSSNKHTYYALPSMLDRMKLKQEFLPDKSTWGGKTEEQIRELTKRNWKINQ
jgi:hypothetical protein